VTDRPVRSDAIDINPVADGYVVYDPATDLVHYLNHTAAMVLELCDGRDTVTEIAAFLAEVFAEVPDVPQAVTDCVGQLRGLGLVQPAPAQTFGSADGGSAYCGPAVVTIPAQAAPAASTLGRGPADHPALRRPSP
jgi:Coenzyme PQQ synthesis protein D (PqqD)